MRVLFTNAMAPIGYMVFSGLRKSTGAIGFRVIIQSEKDPAYLESRVNAFLEMMRVSAKAPSFR